MSSNIRIGTSLDDKVSGPLDRIRGKIDAMGKGAAGASFLGNLGANAVTAGIGLVTGALSGVVDKLGEAQTAYREDEASQARLRTSLAANVPSYKGNTDAIEAVLSQRMKLGFSDDEQRASLAQLVTRTRDSSKALEIQATAMDLARLKGISLEAATNVLGKAYSGNIGALARAGIAVDKNATATEALAAVQKAATGQAEAFSRTSEGRVAASQLKVGEAMEKIGRVVAKVSDVVIPALADAFSAVVDGIGKFVAENRQLFDTLGQIASIIGTVLIAAFERMATVTGAAFGVIGTVIGAVFDTVKFVVSGIVGAIRNVMDIVAQLPGPFQEGAAAVRDSLNGMQADIEGFGKTAVTTVAANGMLIPVALTTAMDAGTGAVQDAAEDMSDEIPEAVEAAKRKVVTIARETPAAMARGLAEGASAVGQAAEALKQAIEDRVSPAKEMAAVQGELTGKALAKALRDKDPEVRAAGQAYKDTLEERLFALQNKVPDIALATGTSYADALVRVTNDQVAKAAREVARVTERNLTLDYTAQGERVGQTFADGLAAKAEATRRAAARLAQIVWDNLHTSSPAKEGPLSRDGGPGAWGAKLVTGFAEQMAAASGRVTQAAAIVAGAGTGIVGGLSSAASGGGLGGSVSGMTFVYSPVYSSASPAEARAFAVAVGPELERWRRNQGLV